MKVEPVIFSTAQGNLRGIIHYPNTTPSGWIITCHGLFSSKDSDKFIVLGERFAKENFAVLRFDFRGCGESDGAVEDTTITGRKEDLQAAMAFIQQHILSSSAPRVGFLGSSLGGYISLLVAPHHASVKAVVTWATPFSFDALRTAITHNTSPRLKEDFFIDAGSYHPQRFVPRVHNLLIIHGERDETVTVGHAQRLYQAAREPKQLDIVTGADHIFSNPTHREKAINLSLNWFKHYL
jgi:alpha/beta superfamily hydrolase